MRSRECGKIAFKRCLADKARSDYILALVCSSPSNLMCICVREVGGGGKQKTNFHPVWIKKVYGILGHTKLECLVKDMDNEDIYLYGVANAILDRWDSSAERFLFFLQLIY